MPTATQEGLDFGRNYFNNVADRSRKDAAYNALKNTYGDIAGDPEAATNLQNLAQSAELQPGRVQAQADTSALSQAQARSVDANTGKVPGEIALTAAQTGSVDAGTAKTNAETGQIAANDAATRALQTAQTTNANAQAGAVPSEINARNAQAAQSNAEAAKLNQATQDAADVSRAQDGLALVQTLQRLRDKAATAPGFGVRKDAGGQAIGDYLKNLPPEQLAAMGIDAAHVGPLIQALTQDPSKLDQIGETIQSKLTSVTAGGLSTAGLDTAADKYIFDGTLPQVGIGKAGSAARTAVINAATIKLKAQGIDTASLPQQWQTNKAGQKFANDLADTSQTKVGGKIVSINAIADHMDLLEQFVGKLQNKDLQAANSINQLFKAQTGKAIPLTFDAQKALVAGELTRYYTSRGDTGLRQEFEKTLSKAESPQQLIDVINTMRADAGAQLAGFRQQADAYNMTSQFDAQLRPSAQALLTGTQPAPAAGGDGGWSNFRAH